MFDLSHSVSTIMTRSIPFHDYSHVEPDGVKPGTNCDEDALEDPYKIDEHTPYISSIDVEDEILTIFNPSPRLVDLSHFYVQDDKAIHKLVFPVGTEIESKGVLYIYTCPGAYRGTFEMPNVLWKNLDGSLRKKEVLNNGKLSSI